MTAALLTGWGRTAPTAATVRRVDGAAQVRSALLDAASAGRPSRGVIARGLGRSYGDAAECAGGTVLDVTGIAGVIEADLELGLIRVGAGVSLQTLMEAFLPLGWFVPVTPGTRQVTVGGAIAADIHGKNHHRDGSFCSHVRQLTLLTPIGQLDVTPENDPELFWATAGGMGLTGVVTDATLQMLASETSWMLVDTERAEDLDDVVSRMRSGDDGYHYSVAWIDCQARGRHLGRSVLTRGDHARLADLPATHAARARSFAGRTRFDVPITPPLSLLNPLTVGAFNELWYRKAPRHETRKPEPLATFFHPLDGVGDWNRLYGPKGFVQYQFVVPEERVDTLRLVIEKLAEERVASFLAVLKRFGPGDPGPLSFPTAGWTLALDLPAGPAGLAPLLDRLDEEVAAAGGRIYLAKDSRLRPDLLGTMYPRLDEWMAVRSRVDPDGVIQSDLSRRLGLTAP